MRKIPQKDKKKKALMYMVYFSLSLIFKHQALDHMLIF